MHTSNSFHEIFVHLSWACRDHEPLIRPKYQIELNRYIRNYIIQIPGLYFKAAESTPDHIHLALQIAPNHNISDIVAHIKGNSAQHINKKYGANNLVWQRGFSAASFAIENLDAVTRYISDQAIHHERQTVRIPLEPPDEGENRNDIFLHATWHCHCDQAMITPEIESIISKFLPSYCSESGFELIGRGGTETHLHVAFKPLLSMKISEAIGKMKGGTTHHVNERVGTKALQWQHGYGVVSFAGKNLDGVMNYIGNQKEHHRKLTLQEKLERCGFPSLEADRDSR